MRTPGFSAEASLYRTSGRYYMGRTPVQDGETIYPAQQACWDLCYRCCVSACRSDGNPLGWCQRLCRYDCEAYGPCWPRSWRADHGVPSGPGDDRSALSDLLQRQL
jgi:hypothetical protein